MEIKNEFELCIVILLCIISGLNWYSVCCHTSWNCDIKVLLFVVNISCSSGMEEFNTILLHNHCHHAGIMYLLLTLSCDVHGINS